MKRWVIQLNIYSIHNIIQAVFLKDGNWLKFHKAQMNLKKHQKHKIRNLKNDLKKVSILHTLTYDSKILYDIICTACVRCLEC